MNKAIHETVKDYYGKELAGSEDLKTDACCTVDSVPDYLKPIMASVHPEVSGKYYGCGLVAPEQLEGLTILDLGSGSGQDCFVLSALVGEHGSVVGVDMTDEQLAVANQYRDYHREQFGFSQNNVSFKKGYLEKLDQLGLAENSFDIIVSNCVINLCEDKQAVLDQAFKLLKPGGELYFSDVYADRRIPAELVNDPVLYGECLSGALYWNDFLHLAKKAGFADPRLVSDRPLGIENPGLAEKLAGYGFYSAVYRLFKVADLEPTQEDYGQSVTYLGDVDYHGCSLDFDKTHTFKKGQPTPVSGNTFKLLAGSRFAKHFSFSGDFTSHQGYFPLSGVTLPFGQSNAASSGCCG